MKKALAIVLLLTTLLLSACGGKEIPQISSGGNETETLETQAVDPTTIPENVTEAATESFSQPVTEESQPTQLGKKEEVSTTTPTEESKPSSEKETQPTTPTVPPATDPPPTEELKPTELPTESTAEPSVETKPTEPPLEDTEETTPTKESIDTATIENIAESYAASLGFVVDNSLGKGNSGYYPPDYRPFNSMEESINAAVGLVSATKNQLNSRFSEERCETLVEGAYGLARINCQVVYSHTDELGDWYYTYVFYG